MNKLHVHFIPYHRITTSQNAFISYFCVNINASGLTISSASHQGLRFGFEKLYILRVIITIMEAIHAKESSANELSKALFYFSAPGSVHCSFKLRLEDLRGNLHFQTKRARTRIRTGYTVNASLLSFSFVARSTWPRVLLG